MKTWVALNSTSKRTRVVVTLGDVVVLRASLPPLATLRHATAVTTLLEALSLWADERLCVALSAGSLDDCFRCDLADEMGVGGWCGRGRQRCDRRGRVGVPPLRTP